ncbi:alanine and proline-rich secreted protein Apa [Mycobacterium shigaense]|uniref:Alanine and proline-rich secreted protein Apa n=1 Tax=Mycobacterium shigaense TaxID=722731 RepID=A0A1Z4EIG8_9MYCO|nr:alanine and proline-rich secreted protein Apa [Mycobacterium shigaense]PRI13666.1 hypothetical protein B2J96_18505 [Mycobacterium shigaense]BAX92775.1 alanine and proline-rich secreted protein Apa [Mycobacterium shigaense]
MSQVDPHSTRRRGLWATLAIATVTSASVVTIALPATAKADPEVPTPVPPTTTTAAPPASPAPPVSPAPAASPAPGAPLPPQAPPASPGAPVPPPPVDPNAPPPAPGDPNAPIPPPPPDPNAGRVGNAVGGFSFVVPASWVESDATHLDYGSELLSKTTGPPSAPGQAPPVANDTRIVMGRLDQKLYASAEPNDAKAAVRLGSDMGEFFMPYPGTRINQETTPLSGANGLTGSASFYEVKFSDASKPNGQIWTGVVSSPAATPGGGAAQRWFVVYLGTSNNPVDKGAAKALAESIQPWTAPPAAPAPPGAPAPGGPAPTPAPAPGAPATDATPTATPTPQRTLPTT